VWLLRSSLNVVLRALGQIESSAATCEMSGALEAIGVEVADAAGVCAHEIYRQLLLPRAPKLMLLTLHDCLGIEKSSTREDIAEHFGITDFSPEACAAAFISSALSTATSLVPPSQLLTGLHLTHGDTCVEASQLADHLLQADSPHQPPRSSLCGPHSSAAPSAQPATQN
jgi:hypothetical protein